MLEQVFWIQFWLLLAIAAGLLTLGGLGRPPSGLSVSLLATTELILLIQLVIATVLVSTGARAATDTIEFFGYLIVAILLPIAAFLWAMVERTRWSTVVLGLATLVVWVMLIRMQQLWTGVSPIALEYLGNR